MLRMFRTINGQVEQIQKPENGSWLCLSAPTDVELANVSMETGIDLADLRALWMTRNARASTSRTTTR